MQSLVASGTIAHIFNVMVDSRTLLLEDVFVFSAMLGSTVDTIFAAVHGAFAAPRTWQSLVRRCVLLRSA